MSRSALTLKALGERIARPPRAWRNRIWAHRARLGGAARRWRRRCPSRCCSATPGAAQDLLDGRLAGARPAGRPPAAARSGRCRCPIRGSRPSGRPASGSTIWPRSATGRRGRWRRAGCRTGSTASAPAAGRAGTPRLAGRRAKRWAVHAALLTEGLDRGGADRFWRALAAHQRYLAGPGRWRRRGCRGCGRWPGWSGAGLVLPHRRPCRGAGRDGGAGRGAGRRRGRHAVARRRRIWPRS